jgi:hypothetical protein
MRGTIEKHAVATCGRCGTTVGADEAWTFSDEGTTESLCAACAADVAGFVRFAPASLQPPAPRVPSVQVPAPQVAAPEDDEDSSATAAPAWVVLLQGLMLLAAAFAPFVLFAWLVHR